MIELPFMSSRSHITYLNYVAFADDFPLHYLHDLDLCVDKCVINVI